MKTILLFFLTTRSPRDNFAVVERMAFILLSYSFWMPKFWTCFLKEYSIFNLSGSFSEKHMYLKKYVIPVRTSFARYTQVGSNHKIISLTERSNIPLSRLYISSYPVCPPSPSPSPSHLHCSAVCNTSKDDIWFSLETSVKVFWF